MAEIEGQTRESELQFVKGLYNEKVTIMNYFGFSFPHAFLLGDPEWFKRLGLQLSPDVFDPFDHGLDSIFDILHDVLKGEWIEKKNGGCYMFNHEFPVFLRNLELVDRFIHARKRFETRMNIAFEPIIHVSTRSGDFPLEGNYLRILHEELESCATINSKSLVIHPPEGARDVTADLIDLFCSNPFIDLLTNTDVILYVENGLHEEFFGSLQNILDFSSRLSDKLKEIGFGSFISRIQFCFDTGHLLLWRYHHRDGPNHADKEIEISLPEFGKETGVLHMKACDSGKEYITPFARKSPLFLRHSEKVIEWLEIIKNVNYSCPRYFCMEIPKRNFIINEIIDFRKNFI